jgi:hypothetical protein
MQENQDRRFIVEDAIGWEMEQERVCGLVLNSAELSEGCICKQNHHPKQGFLQ